MLLSKEFAVSMNLTACKLKQYTALMLKKGRIDLTPEQFLLTDILWNMGPMSQQKIADNMQKDKNSVTKLVDALEKKGLIERKKDALDRRSNIVVLTKKGEELKNEAKQKGISMLDRILVGIQEDELRAMLRTLEKIASNMSAACDE